MSTHAPHPFQPDDPEPATEHEFLGVALRQLLIEKGVYSADEEREQIEAMQTASPGNGARIVAKAWTDPAFAERLLTDADGAIAELGYDAVFPLIVLANSPEVHHVVVCTLCSCYPRALLGPQPAWYKSGAYRSRVVREPRAVLREFGLEVASDREVRVHDSTAELRYMVLPMRPPGTEGMNEVQLAELVSRDSLIGVSEASSPSE